MKFLGIFLHGKRTISMILAIALSVILVISMFSISEALKKSVKERYEQSEDLLITTKHLFNGILGSHTLSEKLQNNSNVSIASPVAFSITSANINNTDIPLIAIGVIPEKMDLFIGKKKILYLSGQKLVINDFFREMGDPHYENNFRGPWTDEVLLDNVLKDKYSLNIGDHLRVEGIEGSRNFTIIGFFSTTLTGEGVVSSYVQGAILLHLSELQSLMGLDRIGGENNNSEMVDKCWGIFIKVSPILSHNNKKFDDFVNTLKLQYPFYNILTKEERFEDIKEQYKMVEIFSYSISIISASIGMLFLLGIMLINIQQNKKVLTVLKAIGVSNTDIYLEVFLTSFLLIIVSFFIGIIPSIFVINYINNYFIKSSGIEVIYAVLNFSTILKSFLFYLISGGAISILPAWKAMTIKLEGMQKLI